MKPVPFDYLRPDSVEAACAALANDEDARVIAGGQTLIPMLAMRSPRRASRKILAADGRALLR